MGNITIVILLLAIITALAEVADRVRIPYPILLVLVGIGVSLVPGLPVISLEPDVVFLLFLPPVLYSAAWSTSWPDFKAASRPISLLAIGCVLFTTTLVAVVAHYFIPGFGWPESFVLGAIISPPDAVAASAATKGLGIPRRVTTILEGESLVNDATGLIAYKYGIAAAASGTFIFWLASINFFYVAIVGILLGLVLGQIFKWIHKITPDNPINDTALTFIAPYTAYLLAEQIHVSGVLSVVTCGLFLSWNSSEIFKHQSRLNAWSVWETVIFILNGLIFILIGLQLPVILKHIQNHSFLTLLFYASIISIATIVLRLIWVYPATYLPRWLSKNIRQRERRPPIKMVTIVAWSGMRGVVSLAAALALPLSFGNNRDMIIFLTFSVIFATLVIQGMSLPHLIKWLGIKPSDEEQHEEQQARLKIVSKVIEHIEENYSLALSDEVLNQVKTKYEIRVQRIRKGEQVGKISEEQVTDFHRVQREIIDVERSMLNSMRKEGQISEEALRKIEYELDLEETRLILET
ncbi:MAG TPA: Na+/H+ antiporter [Cyclobacteriaceae bacterium]|jgi:CPA1 family monovalent cation:H+ antiporter|nr:Na+/H+ antiporter [Cyclobacteriaceae bacterium]